MIVDFKLKKDTRLECLQAEKTRICLYFGNVIKSNAEDSVRHSYIWCERMYIYTHIYIYIYTLAEIIMEPPLLKSLFAIEVC